MIYRALLATGLLACAVAPASSQVIGIPVVNNGAATGVSIGADVGFANSDYVGGGTAIGAHASAGIGFFGVSAMISRFAPKSGDAIVSPGASATLRLLGGPLVPFRITMQAGIARWTYFGTTDLHVPLSIGLSATIPNPAFAIKPWIAPRIDLTHTSGTSIEGDSETDNSVHFGISGGVDVALLNGISIRAAYDRVSANGASPSIFSLGLGFTP
jgi:opacity protein-like surface antigen